MDVNRWDTGREDQDRSNITEIVYSGRDRNNSGNEHKEHQSRNANYSVQLDLHTTTSEIPVGTRATAQHHNTLDNEIPGCLPDYEPTDRPSTVHWGRQIDGSVIILLLSYDVMGQLINKHPDAQEAKLGSLLFGPIDDVLDVLFQQINGEMVREPSIRTKCSD